MARRELERKEASVVRVKWDELDLRQVLGETAFEKEPFVFLASVFTGVLPPPFSSLSVLRVAKDERELGEVKRLGQVVGSS